MINYLEPNHELIEGDFINKWRVFNGAYWTHGFNTEQQAIDFAQNNGGTAVGQCKTGHYSHVRKVDSIGTSNG